MFSLTHEDSFCHSRELTFRIGYVAEFDDLDDLKRNKESSITGSANRSADRNAVRSAFRGAQHQAPAIAAQLVPRRARAPLLEERAPLRRGGAGGVVTVLPLSFRMVCTQEVVPVEFGVLVSVWD